MISVGVYQASTNWHALSHEPKPTSTLYTALAVKYFFRFCLISTLAIAFLFFCRGGKRKYKKYSWRRKGKKSSASCGCWRDRESYLPSIVGGRRNIYDGCLLVVEPAPVANFCDVLVYSRSHDLADSWFWYLFT